MDRLEATARTEALDAEDAFVAGRRLDPAPAAIADTLGLAATPGWRAKAALGLRRVVPTSAWLRDRYPLARRGGRSIRARGLYENARHR